MNNDWKIPSLTVFEKKNQKFDFSVNMLVNRPLVPDGA